MRERPQIKGVKVTLTYWKGWLTYKQIVIQLSKNEVHSYG